MARIIFTILSSMSLILLLTSIANNKQLLHTRRRLVLSGENALVEEDIKALEDHIGDMTKIAVVVTSMSVLGNWYFLVNEKQT